MKHQQPHPANPKSKSSPKSEDKHYFTNHSDFPAIIKSILTEETITNISPIDTGWTNFVFEVTTRKNTFIFRFPRDNFWADALIKDTHFSQFAHQKIHFCAIDPELHYYNNCPFASYHKIPGTTLATIADQLSPSQIQSISSEIAQFMFALHSLNPQSYQTSDHNLELPHFLDQLLSEHINSKVYQPFWNLEALKTTFPSTHLVHGDLNSSNIVVDDNFHIATIIDFGFAGLGHPYFDIARIIGRCPAAFSTPILNAYQSLSNSPLNQKEIDQLVSLWSQIDQSYIAYLKSQKQLKS